MKKIQILMLLIAAGFVSCESATYNEISNSSLNPVYNIQIKPIIQNNCVTCHNPEYGQQPFFQAYEDVKEATLNGNLACRIDESCGSVMPPTGRMPQSTIDIIKRWKDNGCPEN